MIKVRFWVSFLLSNWIILFIYSSNCLAAFLCSVFAILEEVAAWVLPSFSVA
ncbi:Uncharacterised protein [Streptococcus pneumoniae]|nr:Uncharacterised protein [Streptococcus pneumoniae]